MALIYSILIIFRFSHQGDSAYDIAVVFADMGKMQFEQSLRPTPCVGESCRRSLRPGSRAGVAEDAIKIFGVVRFVAGEIPAFPVAEKRKALALQSNTVLPDIICLPLPEFYIRTFFSACLCRLSSPSTSSPGFNQTRAPFGWPSMTPEGVPVKMRSPGFSEK